MKKTRIALLVVFVLFMGFIAWFYVSEHDSVTVKVVLDESVVMIPDDYDCPIEFAMSDVTAYRVPETDARKIRSMMAKIHKRGSEKGDYSELTRSFFYLVYDKNAGAYPKTTIPLSWGRGEVRLAPGSYIVFSTPNWHSKSSGWAYWEIPKNLEVVTVPALQWYDL